MLTFIKNADFVNCVEGDRAGVGCSHLFPLALCWEIITVEGRLKKHV